MFEAKLFIGGIPMAARAGATYDRSDPITERTATRAAAASAVDAMEAANAAAAAFPAWSSTPAAERTVLLNRAATLLEARANQFMTVMAEEIGASQTWTQFNCDLAVETLRHAATLTDRLEQVVQVETPPGVSSFQVRQPAGVVLGIAPWNAPVVLAARAVATPLACGNTVVLKASELCPKTQSLLVEILGEAGLPPGSINLVTNAPENAAEVVEALIGHAAVRRVNFTGSTRVGRGIAEACARHLKPCLLELSGKAPLIILDDADLDEAVKAATFGAFFNQGQICMSTERIIVDRAIADDFMDRFVRKAASLKAGDPRSGRFALGSLISETAAGRVRGLIDDALAKGGKLIAGGELDHAILQPTILDHVNSAMRLYYEESFGPIAAVIRVGGIEEAVSVANDTDYGLAAAVHGRDTERAMGVARRLETGICHINGPTIQDDPRMPFGGMKASGHGRFGGEAGVREFTELRWITINENKQDYPI